MGIAVPVRTCLTTEVVMHTPWPVLSYVHVLHGEIQALRERIEVLEAKLSANSTYSNKPLSSDNPFTTGKETNKSNRKDRKKHKGFRQQVLSPTQVTELYPGECSCGCNRFTDVEPYFVHQTVELPEIKLEVTHFILHRGRCRHCGKMRKVLIPPQHRTGYGPRLSSIIAVIAGTQADSRRVSRIFSSRCWACMSAKEPFRRSSTEPPAPSNPITKPSARLSEIPLSTTWTKPLGIAREYCNDCGSWETPWSPTS